MTSADEKLERVSRRLQDSPQLAEAVRQKIAQNQLPMPAGAEVPERVRELAEHDRAPLESLLKVDFLEAIVQRVGRPPLLIRNDAVELEPLDDFPAGTDEHIRGVEPFVTSVGRVEFLNHSMSWGGTGWVIAEENGTRVVATNRHVAEVVARRTSAGAGTLLRSPVSGVRYGVNVDFKEEVASLPGDARPYAVQEIVYLADTASPDVALLRIAGDDLPPPLPLAEDEAEPGQLVAIIGYPAFDSRNNVDDQAFYFRDLYDVKRFAPGLVLQGLSGRTILNHDCTTLGGNSGSPLIRLEDRKVVGLHFAGVFGRENSAVGAATLRELLRTGRPGLAPLPGPTTLVTEAPDGIRTPEELTDRDGYDPEFLGDGFTAPWPGLPATAEQDLARPSDELADRPGELRYTHFSVLFSTARRQPVVTAVNLDGASLVTVKRGRDMWFADGRIPLEVQLTAADYDDREIDRGHMVRRQDPNWDPAATPGARSDLAERANADTFHYTNAAPQHSDLNQGLQLWLGLENHVLESARTSGFRACVFTGPVHRPDDPELKPGVFAPREFWKLVVMVDADRQQLHATAYVLSQGDMIRDLLEARGRTEGNEGFVLGPFRTFQVAVRDLAEATGFDLTAYLDADPLGATEASDVPLFVPLERGEDIRA